MSTLRALIEELQQQELMYGPDCRIIIHGPDGHPAGGYGSNISIILIGLQYAQDKKVGDGFSALLLEGQGNDFDRNGKHNFRWRDASSIEERPSSAGPREDCPPGP